MKRAVSVSLGSPSRDKKVQVTFGDQTIEIERIGTGGDIERARQLFRELDGQVEALSVGGIDLYVHIDGRDYPVRDALKLVQDIQRTPVIDGRMLKYALESRVFELTAPLLGGVPHFERAFIPSAIDRIGLCGALEQVAGAVYMGDLMFYLGVPLAVRGVKNFKRIAKVLMPVMGFLPVSSLLPPGSIEERHTPKYEGQWKAADLIAGDLHYIRNYSPADLGGKMVITNTTTPENIEMLRQRGVRKVLTTTPRYEGRSFGINMMEAVLTAYSGARRQLSIAELNVLIDELQLRPTLIDLENS